MVYPSVGNLASNNKQEQTREKTDGRIEFLWQSRGRRFDPVQLHQGKVGADQKWLAPLCFRGYW